MLLSLISTDLARFQFRDTPFSARTVASIVEEGLDLAKLDPIPLIRSGKIRFIVAGDGHSRFEAISQLAAQGRLPAQWKTGNDWDIPCRVITEAEAKTLSWTANLSRDDFTPCEQAKVFQAMLDSGMSIKQIATEAHRSVGFIQQTIPLNALCRDLRDAMALSPDAGGIDAYIGKLLGSKFQQYGITVGQQQELWHKVLKHADLTAGFVRSLLDRIGQQLAGRETQDVLFAMPASVTAVVADLRDRAQVMRRADVGMNHLIFCEKHGVWDQFPDLKKIITEQGDAIRKAISAQVDDDASLIARMCYAQA
jgi:hypothetical protein